MNENIAPADLRYMIRALRSGTGAMDALQNINTTILPNGAACYVIEDAAWWVLNKTSTQAAVAGLVLVPGSGPGRWMLQAAGIAQSPAIQVLGGGNTFTPNGNWGISGTANFAIQSPAPPFWALTALGSILTYTGAPRQFLVQFSGSFEVGNVDAARTVFAGISLNDDLTGAAVVGTGQAIDQTVAAKAEQLTTNRLLSLVTGDTLRPKAAVAAAANSLATISSTMVVIPI